MKIELLTKTLVKEMLRDDVTPRIDYVNTRVNGMNLKIEDLKDEIKVLNIRMLEMEKKWTKKM